MQEALRVCIASKCQSSATAATCCMFHRSLFSLYPMNIHTEISSVVQELLAGYEYAGQSLQY